MLGREELFFAFVRELLHLLFREDVAESHYDWLAFFFLPVFVSILEGSGWTRKGQGRGQVPGLEG